MAKDETKTKQETGPVKGPNAFPALTVDWKLYEHYLEEADLTDDQKRQFLEALWSIIVAFVDLGYGIHPVQQSCGEIGASFAAAALDVVDSEAEPSPNPPNATAPPTGGAAERSR